MSGMESNRPSPEQWTQDENVLEVLGYMLAVPLGNHRVAVSNALDGEPFANAHAAALFCAARFQEAKMEWSPCAQQSGGVPYMDASFSRRC